MPKSEKPGQETKRHHPYRRGTHMNRAAFERSARTDYAHASGTTYEGFHSSIVYREPHAPANRDGRFLTHLSTALKAWYREVSSTSEIEIQIALFAGSKYIISSNADATAAKIFNELVAVSVADFFKNVAVTASAVGARSNAQEAFRVERHGLKLAKELTGARAGGAPMINAMTTATDAGTAAQTGRDAAVHVNAYDPIGQAFADFLTGTDKSIAIVTSGGNDAHAEQKIMLALCKAAIANAEVRTGSLVFAGTFRPCRGCYESLSVVQKYVFRNLQFGVRPGHYWLSTSAAHGEILETCRPFIVADTSGDFDEGGRMVGLSNTTYRPKLRRRRGSATLVDHTNYDTDSDSDED